jgi:hypothetical protein
MVETVARLTSASHLIAQWDNSGHCNYISISDDSGEIP